MSETRTILEDSAAKLFAAFEEPALLRRVEAGEWPPEIWQGIAGLGLEQIFAGASDDPWRDAAVILKACGRQIVPAPLAETLAAGAVLAAAGLEPVDGALTLAMPAAAALAIGDDGRVSGRLSRLEWAERDEASPLAPSTRTAVIWNWGAVPRFTMTVRGARAAVFWLAR